VFYPAPVVHNAANERKMVLMRWSMPPPPRTSGPPVTNIRNTGSGGLATNKQHRRPYARAKDLPSRPYGPKRLETAPGAPQPVDHADQRAWARRAPGWGRLAIRHDACLRRARRCRQIRCEFHGNVRRSAQHDELRAMAPGARLLAMSTNIVVTSYIGITEPKLPRASHLSNVVTFPKKTA
jgi:hypothetical protein